MADSTDAPRIVSLDVLDNPSRRAFCKTAGVGMAVVALPACWGGATQGTTYGTLDDTDAGAPGSTADLASDKEPRDLAMKQSANPDLAQQQGKPEDMARQAPPDLAMKQQMNSCPGGVFNTGMKPNAFAANTATYFQSQDAFVCRDGGGLFALTSICNHQGCTNNFKAGAFKCPCHGANFSLNGVAMGGPGHGTLDHYALCIDNDGSVAFDPNTTVAAATRVNA